TVGSADVVKIAEGKKAWLPVEVEMTEEDIADNAEVLVRAFYGERELSRVKLKEKRFPLEVRSGYTRYAVYSVIILLILVLLYFLATKKKCPHCGHRNARGRKTCEKCGYH